MKQDSGWDCYECGVRILSGPDVSEPKSLIFSDLKGNITYDGFPFHIGCKPKLKV